MLGPALCDEDDENGRSPPGLNTYHATRTVLKATCVHAHTEAHTHIYIFCFVLFSRLIPKSTQ